VIHTKSSIRVYRKITIFCTPLKCKFHDGDFANVYCNMYITLKANTNQLKSKKYIDLNLQRYNNGVVYPICRINILRENIVLKVKITNFLMYLHLFIRKN